MVELPGLPELYLTVAESSSPPSPSRAPALFEADYFSYLSVATQNFLADWQTQVM